MKKISEKMVLVVALVVGLMLFVPSVQATTIDSFDYSGEAALDAVWTPMVAGGLNLDTTKARSGLTSAVIPVDQLGGATYVFSTPLENVDISVWVWGGTQGVSNPKPIMKLFKGNSGTWQDEFEIGIHAGALNKGQAHSGYGWQVFTAPAVVRDGWNELRVHIGQGISKPDLYFNGVYQGKLLQDFGAVTKVQLTKHSEPQYAAFFDDFTVTVVPEPATMLLLGLGGLVLRKRCC
jgi:hypothetical protein